jgi:hypothetical protein
MALTRAKVGSCLLAPLLAQLPLKMPSAPYGSHATAIKAVDEAKSAFDANVLACEC